VEWKLVAKSKPAPVTRFHRNQTREVAAVRRLRKEATDLRSRISHGSYELGEAERFWRLAENASSVLDIANSELAERAGLGDSFFTTLVRDRRRPKLANFLRALTALIDVADERLFDIDHSSGFPSASFPSNPAISLRIKEDHAELLSLARSLNQLARDEIEKLETERPNDPDIIIKYEKQRELLQVFATGFERIARAIAAFESKPNEPVLLGNASDVVNKVGSEVTQWLKKNGTEVVDWGFRLPTFVAGVAALGWAGANMTVGTTFVAALVGGDKVLKAIRARNKSE
jgi:hypothetical protein